MRTSATVIGKSCVAASVRTPPHFRATRANAVHFHASIAVAYMAPHSRRDSANRKREADGVTG
jgi:hypothetical protein